MTTVYAMSSNLNSLGFGPGVTTSGIQRQIATIHRQDYAGYNRRGVGAEKNNGTYEFFGFQQAIQGNAHEQSLAQCRTETGRLHPLFERGCQNLGGTDSVDADAVTRILYRDFPRELVDATLRNAVR